MILRRLLLLASAILLAQTVIATATAQSRPEDSVYLLDTPLVTQEGSSAGLDLHRGHPVVISMFYGSCPHVCPVLIASILRLERELPDDRRGRLRVLLVSLDPEGDTPAQLAAIAQRHRIDPARWTFARTEAPEVRRLAAVLGIQYRRLPDGSYNHASVVTLLDGEGRIQAQTRQLLGPDAKFRTALRLATGP